MEGKNHKEHTKKTHDNIYIKFIISFIKETLAKWYSMA